ncbi:MAG TPA: transposase [Dehalococcoidia bacterium]|nr:transposase [Dehalococcoidia bacterium]
MDYKRRSIRLPGYDYRQSGAYYVTICTHGRECVFSDETLAAAVKRAWRVVASASGPLDEFVVMPNHVHGVIWIAESGTSVGVQQQYRWYSDERRGTAGMVYQMAHGGVAAPLRPEPRLTPATTAAFAFAKRPVEAGSLSAIVRTFKSASAKRINRLAGTPGAPLWQRNYYEHVVRDEDDLRRIREYIRDNPAKWAEDPLNPSVAQQSSSSKI